ncbi:hypothetical protein DL95DRAFT_507557 [Leptodontidium sp. 2 PMI_412]|nr:hypothetical protein DL95DRAFT_507557 [Leptodontidium sp. 2 PMI_412]
MKAFIRRLFGRNPKKKEGGHYKLQIEVSRPPDNDTTMSWHAVEAGVMPAREGHFVSRTCAEALGFDIPALIEQTPIGELELCLHWNNMSRDASRTKGYTHKGSFGIGAGLQHDVVLGRDTWDLEGYPDSYEGAVRIESTKSRTNSWVSKLSSKTPSWASSRNTSKRAASSKRGSVSRHGTGDLQQDKFRAHAVAREETPMPVTKTIVFDTIGAEVSPVTNCHSDATTSLEDGGIERTRLTGSGEGMRQRGQHQAVYETSYGMIEHEYQIATKRAEPLPSDQLTSLEATGALSSATVYRDFSMSDKTTISPSSPAKMYDTENMGPVAADALHVEIRIGSGQDGLPSMPPPDHQDDPIRPCTPTQQASNAARSVGSHYTQSPQPRYDWNQSQTSSNSQTSESTGFADANLASTTQTRNKLSDNTKAGNIREHSRLSPGDSSGRNFEAPMSTPYQCQSAIETNSPTPKVLDTQLDANKLHTQDLVVESARESRKSSQKSGKSLPKSGSRHRNRPKKPRRPGDLISPRRVAPAPSADAEDQSTEIQKKGTNWTWDEHANAFFHVDSDTQSMVWYSDSDSEDV